MSAPRDPAGPAPLRRPGSIRRTTTIDTRWPDGLGQSMVMEGRARDAATPMTGGAPIVAGTGSFTITASAQREILAIDVSPEHPAAQRLVGARAGGASRVAMGDLLGDIRGTPLFQLLDDFAGASLVAGWIWSRWVDDWAALRAQAGISKVGGRQGSMAGVCTGFAPGSSALAANGSGRISGQSSTPVGPLANPADLAGWHALGEETGITMRRARRLDLWREGDVLKVDLGFQDSGTAPGGGRIAIHEYSVTATIDPVAETLLTVAATPWILPYAECPGATAGVARMIGQPTAAFRQAVLDTLPGVLGCTHLNDVLRSLADVGKLIMDMA